MITMYDGRFYYGEEVIIEMTIQREHSLPLRKDPILWERSSRRIKTSQSSFYSLTYSWLYTTRIRYS